MEDGTELHQNGHNENGLNEKMNNNNSGVIEIDYSTEFPTLPVAPQGKPTGGAWNTRPAVRSTTVTQVFTLATDERRKMAFGNDQKNCQTIAQKIAQATGTRIELSASKDNSLTVMIKGPRAKVEEARAKVVRELQTELNREIEIPKEHHRALIGKEGAALRSLEADTNCRIKIPGRDDTSKTIKITGPREGIDRAIAHIKRISEQQAKLAVERVKCAKVYIPWVRGPNNEFLDNLVASTGAKINIPPPAATDETIVITGERDGVLKAAATIRAIVAEKERVVKSVTCQVNRAQHRYVIGQQRSGLHEILRNTGVSVEVPSEEDNSETITLRGDPAKLGEALALVISRASSVIAAQIQAPIWLHKYLIGPKGSILAQLVPNRDKVHIDFDDSGAIYLEGPPGEVKTAQATLTDEVNRLVKEMTVEKVKVHPTLHRHVIGRGGSLISKIKDETGVQINIPNESTNSDEITIEGKKDGVKKAVAEIRQIVSKIENEKSRDIIIEQRFHKSIIGQKGGKIQELRHQYPTVVFSLPEANKKSDVINLRGDRNEVDAAYKKLQEIVKELQENNYQQAVPVFKDFIKHIVGKAGGNIRKIREETNTRIDLPEGGSSDDKILVTGKKADVEKAVNQLEKIQITLGSIVTLEVNIPVKIQQRLLGSGRRLIADIEEECGGVHVKFPAEKSNSEKVVIRGPQGDAEKAVALLQKMVQDKLDTHEDSLKAKPEFHRYLIGKGGIRIKKLREQYDVRVMFPRENDEDKETIHLIGKEKDVDSTKKELEALIKQLNETIEITVEVDPQHHKKFLSKGASVVKEIQESNGGVSISFPKAGDGASTVIIKGSKQCAESAKQRIEEIVDDYEHRTTIYIDIPHQHHGALLGNRGLKVQELEEQFNCRIQFPNRRKAEEDPSINANQVSITGRDSKCEAARDALLALVPISKQVEVPSEMHRFIIGRGGEHIKKIMEDCDVNIKIPKDQNSNEVTVTGSQKAIEDAIQAIEYRLLEAWKLELEVPDVHHQKIFGQRREAIKKLQEKFKVQILPPRERENASDKITIQGAESNARNCAAEIESILADIKSLVIQEVSLDVRYFPSLVGSRGKNLQKVMKDFEVEIVLPRGDATDPNLVIVAGKDEETVWDCIDFLRQEEENCLSERQDRNKYMSQRSQPAEEKPKLQTVQVKNAPWQLSGEDFPEMGGSTGSAVSSNTGVWGARQF